MDAFNNPNIATQDNIFIEKKKKFEQLQSKLQNLLKEEQSHRVSKLEKKINNNNKTLESSVETLNAKYLLLSEYSHKLKNILEEEKHKKVIAKDIMLQNIKLLKTKYQNKQNENNEILKQSALEHIKNLEIKIQNIKTNQKEVNDSLIQSLNEIKEGVENDLNELKSKNEKENEMKDDCINNVTQYCEDMSTGIKQEIDELNNKRTHFENEFISQFDNVLQDSGNMFLEEAKKRGIFEKNIDQLLKETESNMYSRLEN